MPSTSGVQGPTRRVALVHMPWANPKTAPIQVGLLKSVVTASGFQADTICANLDLLRFIDLDLYLSIAQSQIPLILGEWLFAKEIQSNEIQNKDILSDTGYLEFLLERGQISSEQCDVFRNLRVETVGAYLDFLLRSYPWSQYDLIGFSCVFSQAVPSLALARRIKNLYPDQHIILGGAQCNSPMGEEYLRGFPWLDFVCVGPGERPLVSLLETEDMLNPEIEIPGIARRHNDVVASPKQAKEMALDEIPVADYGTYFSLADELKIDGKVALEASRGCWWGELHHCTFCGISSASMPFRSKTPSKVFEEMQHHSSQYGVLDFIFTDYIMDHRYFKEFLPLLKNSGSGQHCFFETKSNLTKTKLESLANAGVQTIQPGIESFSTNVLRLMSKGTTALQNIQLLRYCKELGLLPLYNILYGFPGEANQDYLEQLDLIGKLEHLQPPVMCGPIVVHRYSPLFTSTASCNYRKVMPRKDYRFLFDIRGVDIEQIAYEHEGIWGSDDPKLNLSHKALGQKVNEWRSNKQQSLSRLEFRLGPRFMRIEDTRGGDYRIHHLDEFGRDCYLFLWNKATTLDSFHQHRRANQNKVDECRTLELVQQLKEAHLVIEEKGRYLSLATPHSSHLISPRYRLTQN